MIMQAQGWQSLGDFPRLPSMGLVGIHLPNHAQAAAQGFAISPILPFWADCVTSMVHRYQESLLKEEPMLHSFHLTDNSLLHDLLEASERLYHRNVATIQRVFCEECWGTIRKHQTLNSCLEEGDFLPYRRKMQESQGELIDEQRRLRRQRDDNIRAYVHSALSRRDAA
jgi:hypothetical protein